MSDNHGRRTRRWNRLRANLRAAHRPCCICHQPIDYSLRWPDPQSFTVQHLKPWSRNPELREDPGNLDAAHFKCNTSLGDRDQQAVSVDKMSEMW
jgi:5-methylcytosine-specific restriction endonuclease McrA